MLERHETTINGQTITYTVKRSLRAKRVRLEVSLQTGLTVVVPRSYKIGQLHKLLKSKERWISNSLAKYSHFQLLSAKKKLSIGDAIPYLGQELELVKRENQSGAGGITPEGNTLVMTKEYTLSELLDLKKQSTQD